MNTIIVPTDFSENSLKAIEFAADFFNQAESRIVVCHVYDIPMGGTSGLFTLMEQLRKQAEKDMEELMNILGAKYVEKEFTLDSKVLQGHFEDSVKTLAKQTEADFVIMGTKGSSGLRDTLIGSNAASILKSIGLPVLAVPNGYEKPAIKEITFSYDGGDIDHKDVALMLVLAKQHNLPIKVLHVRLKDASPIQNWATIDKMFDGLPVSLHEVTAENYQDGLKEGLDGSNSLLVLVRRKKSFWERLINDSDTQQVVKHFQLPVMVLPDVD